MFSDLDPDLQRRLGVLADREARPQAELVTQAVTEFLTRHDEHRLPSWVGSAKDAGATDSSTIKCEIRGARTEVDRRSDGGR